MKGNWLTVTVVALVFAGLLTALVTFTVPVDKMAVLYHWNKPKMVVKPTVGLESEQDTTVEDAWAAAGIEVVRKAGWFIKWPWPIDRVQRHDQRIRTILGTLTQQQLRDNYHASPRLYATWRIVDPIAFERTLKNDEETAKQRLKNIIGASSGVVFGEHELRDVVNTDESRLQFDEIEQAVFDGVKASLEGEQQPYGIEVCTLGISWITLPEETTQKVFERMQKERATHAETLRAEGDKEKRRLVAEARSAAGLIGAQAEADAKRIRAQGEAEAAQYYDTFAKDETLAIFLRKLEAIRRIAVSAARSGRPLSLVLSTDSPVFQLLEHGPSEADLGMLGSPEVKDLLGPSETEAVPSEGESTP